jgi:Cu/Ag efflux protein CusF
MRRIGLAAVVAVVLAGPAWADEAHHKNATADGEVRKVDKDAQKITLRHGPLANLDMPAMTMVFQVADPAMLEQVKAGDKVKFQAEKIGGGYRIIKIEPAN